MPRRSRHPHFAGSTDPAPDLTFGGSAAAASTLSGSGATASTLVEYLQAGGSSHVLKTRQILQAVSNISAQNILIAASVLNSKVSASPDSIQRALDDLGTACKVGNFNMGFLDEAGNTRFLITADGSRLATYKGSGGNLVFKDFTCPRTQAPELDWVNELNEDGVFKGMAEGATVPVGKGLFTAQKAFPYIRFQKLDDAGNVMGEGLPENYKFSAVKFDLSSIYEGITLLAYGNSV